jgi:uncharacterized protein (DUF1501 family)
MDASRRDFLRMAAALGLGRALGAFGLRPGPLDATQDYRALVCLFLDGGNDSANMVLATDDASWSRYQSARNTGPAPIALAAPGTAPTPGALATLGAQALGGVLPIVPRTAQPWPDGTPGTGTRTFALHPLMPNVQQLFQQGHAAVVANVGTLVRPVTRQSYLGGSVPVPRSLFSHSDQASAWQTGGPEGTPFGWGGLLGDVFASSNRNPVFTAISLSGNVSLLAGSTVNGYQVDLGRAVPILGLAQPDLFGNGAAPTLLRKLITDPTGTSPFQTGHASVVARSIAAQGILDAALQGVPAPPDPPLSLEPVSGQYRVSALALKLQAVARLIAAGPSLGLTRQIFFVSQGSYDFHQSANLGHHRLLAELDTALGYFYGTLGALGGQDRTAQVTTCTLSEFGRGFISNGSGTDHGWGGHQLVVGGAVKGGDFYGVYPTAGVDLGGFVNPGALPGTGAWLPTVAVDQLAATLGAWLGLSDAQLLAIFPNLGPLTNGGALGLGFL